MIDIFILNDGFLLFDTYFSDILYLKIITYIMHSRNDCIALMSSSRYQHILQKYKRLAMNISNAMISDAEIVKHYLI